MNASGDKPNPVSVPPGQVQAGVDPLRLNPSRGDLVRLRLEFQRSLIRAGVPRLTPIQVSREGVIVDGHHAVRAAAEGEHSVDVLVTMLAVPGRGCSILDLDVR